MKEKQGIVDEIIERSTKRPPRLFRILRNSGLIVTAISGAILTAPVALPVAIITAAGYLATAGAVATAISQLPNEELNDEIPEA